MIKKKFTTCLIAIIAFIGLALQGCGDCHNDEPEIKVFEAPTFKAVNISAEGETELSASDSKVIVNTTYTVTITINGETTMFRGSHNSNELPVIPGNEVKLIASFGENAVTGYVCFTMPDGTKEVVSINDSDCTWTVPENFVAGSKVIAQWADVKGLIQHSALSSSITLIELK